MHVGRAPILSLGQREVPDGPSPAHWVFFFFADWKALLRTKTKLMVRLSLFSFLGKWKKKDQTNQNDLLILSTVSKLLQFYIFT